MSLHRWLVKRVSIKDTYFGDDSNGSSGLCCAQIMTFSIAWPLDTHQVCSMSWGGCVWPLGSTYCTFWFVSLLLGFCDLGRQTLKFFFKKIHCLSFCLSETWSRLRWLWNRCPARMTLEWSWAPDPLASICQVLALQVCAEAPKIKPTASCTRGRHSASQATSLQSWMLSIVSRSLSMRKAMERLKK